MVISKFNKIQSQCPLNIYWPMKKVPNYVKVCLNRTYRKQEQINMDTYVWNTLDTEKFWMSVIEFYLH